MADLLGAQFQGFADNLAARIGAINPALHCA